MTIAADILDLTMVGLRGQGIVRRYRVVEEKDGIRCEASLQARMRQVGTLRVQVTVDGTDATVQLWWRNALLPRWWTEVVDLPGAAADPYGVEWSPVEGVTDDVRRFATGALGVRQLNTRYTRVRIRAAQDAAWTKGSTWA